MSMIKIANVGQNIDQRWNSRIDTNASSQLWSRSKLVCIILKIQFSASEAKLGETKQAVTHGAKPGPL